MCDTRDWLSGCRGGAVRPDRTNPVALQGMTTFHVGFSVAGPCRGRKGDFDKLNAGVSRSHGLLKSRASGHSRLIFFVFY